MKTSQSSQNKQKKVLLPRITPNLEKGPKNHQRRAKASKSVIQSYDISMSRQKTIEISDAEVYSSLPK